MRANDVGHHYVPQRYLRNFEVPSQPEFILQYARAGGDPKCLPIKAIAQAKGFYEPEMESLLEREVERPGGNAIDKLLGGKGLSDEERRHMAVHLVVML
jgi:hypothetical protein